MDVETRALEALEKVRWFRIWMAVAVYLSIAVVTFGHAAARQQVEIDNSRCFAVVTFVREDGIKETQIDPNKPRVKCKDMTPAVGAGLGAALFWPFYWSWTLSE